MPKVRIYLKEWKKFLFLFGAKGKMNSSKKPIIVGIVLSSIETFLFLLVGYYSGGEDSKLIETLQPYLSDYLMVIVTTWYVVFTYFLLKATIDMRDLQINPSIQIYWDKNSNLDTNKMNGYDFLSTYCKSIFKQESDINEANERYLKLNVKNTKSSDLDSLSIEIGVDCNVSGNNETVHKHRILSLQIEDININPDKTLTITALDLLHIPNHFEVKLTLESLIYKLRNSKNQVAEYSGDKSYSAIGIHKIEDQEPIPIQSNTK